MSKARSATFTIPKVLSPDALAEVLDRYSLLVQPERSALPFKLLDCHDQSLQRSGRVLLEDEGALRLFDGQGQIVRPRFKARGRFLKDFPEGPMKQALAGFPVLRAFVVVGEGQLNSAEYSILDELQKTVVKARVTTLASNSGQATIVQVEGLRGYDRAFAAICAALIDTKGATPGVEAVISHLYPDHLPYQSKPKIPLGQTEPAIEAATDIIRTYLGVARQNEAGVISDIDTEYLHDYRVSLRRIRSVLSLFRGVYSEDETAELKQVFSDLMTATGRLRDLDVYLLEKDRFFNLIPSSLHVGLDGMFAAFQKDRTRELNRLARWLRSAEYGDTMHRLAARFEGASNLQPGPSADLGAYRYACALIWKRYRKVCKLARGIRPETPDEVVHDLRIHCKKLRYLMEFFGPLFDPKDFKTIIKPLKKLQDNLGRFNDCSVQQNALQELVAKSGGRSGQVDGQFAMAAGGLIAVLDKKQRDERELVKANFNHFDSQRTRQLFRTLFHKVED